MGLSRNEFFFSRSDLLRHIEDDVTVNCDEIVARLEELASSKPATSKKTGLSLTGIRNRRKKLKSWILL